MVEITNDIRFLLPIMTSVIIAKLVADGITHSLYHALLEASFPGALKGLQYMPSISLPSVSSLVIDGGGAHALAVNLCVSLMFS